MTITEFANGRGVQAKAVSAYIKRHNELFAGHTEPDGKNVLLDDTAFEILSQKYPLPKPIEVVEDIETVRELASARKELTDAQRVIIRLEQDIAEQAQQIATAEAAQMLLEDKEKQLMRAEEDLRQKDDKITAQEARIASQSEEIISLRANVEMQRERGDKAVEAYRKESEEHKKIVVSLLLVIAAMIIFAYFYF